MESFQLNDRQEIHNRYFHNNSHILQNKSIQEHLWKPVKNGNCEKNFFIKSSQNYNCSLSCNKAANWKHTDMNFNSIRMKENNQATFQSIINKVLSQNALASTWKGLNTIRSSNLHDLLSLQQVIIIAISYGCLKH